MERVGQVPVLVRGEIDGFVLNRLQGALLNEALAALPRRLCLGGGHRPAVRDGLGRRWAFMGPMETIDLNAPGGVADYAARYGPIYTGLDAARQGDPDPWEEATIARLAAEMRSARRWTILPRGRTGGTAG
jgi:L-gulonate 3-dehydrogenase